MICKVILSHPLRRGVQLNTKNQRTLSVCDLIRPGTGTQLLSLFHTIFNFTVFCPLNKLLEKQLRFTISHLDRHKNYVKQTRFNVPRAPLFLALSNRHRSLFSLLNPIKLQVKQTDSVYWVQQQKWFNIKFQTLHSGF